MYTFMCTYTCIYVYTYVYIGNFRSQDAGLSQGAFEADIKEHLSEADR